MSGDGRRATDPLRPCFDEQRRPTQTCDQQDGAGLRHPAGAGLRVDDRRKLARRLARRASQRLHKRPRVHHKVRGT
jgi:hypothetical protein